MNLPDFLRKQTAQWDQVFAQTRTLQRAVTLGFGILCGLGKRTITRAISVQGNAQKDWSADYRVFSRSPWEARELFTPILEYAITEHKLKRLVFSADDTRVWRDGKHVPHTQWHRDPMGPWGRPSRRTCAGAIASCKPAWSCHSITKTQRVPPAASRCVSKWRPS